MTPTVDQILSGMEFGKTYHFVNEWQKYDKEAGERPEVHPNFESLLFLMLNSNLVANYAGGMENRHSVVITARGNKVKGYIGEVMIETILLVIMGATIMAILVLLLIDGLTEAISFETGNKLMAVFVGILITAHAALIALFVTGQGN